ncbi:hypothetical protein BDB00DRAFT_815067 [Zychaea mexicana]|uniref:uncharacterized protein n=1 Tax=Zychaea mexicana TaxID=64656 RepID=UPI0022FEDE4F|nr:uncharacterized protein BDB00DRAFT_815067 [Zychaea mexicana]KAI9495198.1 hypothetical protein BDB00DRAFT_815067 [Zychaea mexicana]
MHALDLRFAYPIRTTNYVSYAVRHEFTSEEDNWGFSRIVNFDRIYQRDDETNVLRY